MLNTNPAGVDLAYNLPFDWVDRVLNYKGAPVLTPLLAALKAVVRRHGAAAIAIESVQELALLAAGIEREAGFRAYEHIFDVLTSAAGGDWPVTTPLEEQRLETMRVFEAAHRLITCDGEWLVLRAFIKNGWAPVRSETRVGRDWVVAKGGVELPVEVKTKQTEGSDLGRLRFAIRGLAMTGEGAFLQRFVLDWTGATDLTRQGINSFYGLLRLNLEALRQALTNDTPLYDTREVASDALAKISVQRYERSEFEIDFELTDPELPQETRSKNRISLIAEPNAYPRYVRIGAVDAHFLRAHDESMLAELEDFVLNRLKIVEQAAKRSRDTMVTVIWEVPFHWQMDVAAVEAKWREWCANAGVERGVLLPIQPFEQPTMLVTEEAAKILPNHLRLLQ